MTGLSSDLISEINYWAVIVAGVLTFFLGGLWYSPALFEQLWLAANNVTEDQLRQLQSQLGAVGFASVLLSYLVMAIAFAVLVTLLKVDNIWGGLALGLLIWAGFAATTGLATNLFSLRSLTAWALDAGFQLVFLLITGAILSTWR